MIPYRDDNPTTITPWLTWMLIGVNVAVFLLTLAEHQRAVWELGFIPWELVRGSRHPDSTLLSGWQALWTSMFMHGGFLHLGGNMLFLWVFGDNIEAAMGRIRFLLFYLLTGLAAHAFQLGSTWIQAGPPPAEPVARHLLEYAFQRGGNLDGLAWFIPTVGASGAISGVLAAYFVLYRQARVHMLVPIGIILTTIRVPAGLAIGWWFGIQVLAGLFARGAGGGVAWWAHIGGFVAGYIIHGAFLGRSARHHARLRRQWRKLR